MRRSCSIFLLLLLLPLGGGCDRSPGVSEEVPTDVVAILGAEPAEGFEPITGPAPITFPPDHGAHPEQQIEWWYTTINLTDDGGTRFGVEVTFFRVGLNPASTRKERSSAWATDDLYMAHFAVTDGQNQRFHAFERFTRGGLDLAGVTADPWRVWNESWELRAADGGPRPFPITLRADGRDEHGTVAIDLTLTSDLGPVLHGEGGYSRKGTEPGNASRYYSYPSLVVSGSLTAGDVTHAVTGTGWSDHEWSTSVLGDALDGWDWFSIQLDDGRRLMMFELRQTDGSPPYGSGSWIEADGSTTPLTRDDFSIEVLDRWRSPESGVEYPSRWILRLRKRNLAFTLTPIVADQELRLATRYWEGAVEVSDESGNALGWGYVELVGYGTRSEEGAP